MSRSRSAQIRTTQNQYLQTNQPNLPPNYRAQATNQLTNDENSNNYSKGQTSFLPQFHNGFINIELSLDKNKKADVPRSNQTMRPKRSRQIVSHIPNPNHLIVLDVPQNQSNLLQVPGSRFGGEIDYRVNQQTNRMSELQPEKVQVRPKADFLSSAYIDPSRAEKYMQERQKRSEKNTLRAERQDRIQNPGVYLISVSESVSDNKGMDKAQPLSNHTKDSHNESSSVIVAKTAQEAKHTTLYTPPSMGTVSSFVFKREKIFWRSFANPEYTLNTNNGEFVINAKKQYAHFNSYYSISASHKQYSDQQQGYLGYLQGNFRGSQFNLYQQKAGRHELLATIYYVSQLSCSQSCRSIEVYLKHPLLNNLGNEKGSLRDLYSSQQNASSRSIIKLVNKQPVWKASMDCYTLDFHKKSKLGSIKNTILVQEDDPRNEVMLFCKTGQHEFLLEMGNPLSPFVAMGFILSSFDFKLCCE